MLTIPVRFFPWGWHEYFLRNHLELDVIKIKQLPLLLGYWGSFEMKMAFTKNFLRSPCLLGCLIARKTTRLSKVIVTSHRQLCLWKMIVLFSCTSFITHMHFWGNKNRELRPFLRPSSYQAPFRSCSSCTHFEKGCQGNPKQSRLYALNAGKCTQHLKSLYITEDWQSPSSFLTGVLRRALKYFEFFFFKSGIQ